MNRNFFTGLAVFFLCVMTLSSCYDKDLFDSDKMSESVEWQPNLVVPVGYAKYEIWDLLNQHDPNADIQNIDNVITLVHMENDIFQFKANEVIDIPNTQATEHVGIVVPDSFTFGGIPVDKSTLVNFDLPIDLTLQKEEGEFALTFTEASIELDKLIADFNIDVSGLNVPFDYIINFKIPSVKVGGVVYETTLNGTKNMDLSEPINLANAEINFETGNKIKYEVVVTIPKQNGITLAGISEISLGLTLNNFSFKRAEGDFGNMSIDIGNGNFDMDVDLWNELDGNYKFADPKVNLTVHNHNIGVPFELDADFTGFNKDGSSVNIKKGDESKLKFEGIKDPTVADKTETNGYNKDNSYIVDLFALPPDDKIVYSGKVNLNYDALVPAKNFITNDAEISLDAAIEVPLHFKASELTFRDTIRDLDLDIDSDKTDNIEKAAIVIAYKSQIPLDVKIEKIFFLDRNMKQVASLSEIVLLESPEVDAEGKSGEVSSKSRIELTRETIDKLDETEHLEIVAKASTSSNGTKYVKIPADAIIDFNLAFEVKLDLSNQ